MKTKHLISMAVCIIAVIATVTSTRKNINQNGYSELILANATALTNSEDSEDFENDDCTGVCSWQLCYKPSSISPQGRAIYSIYHYKRTSIVEICHHYKVQECPEGWKPGGEFLINDIDDCK